MSGSNTVECVALECKATILRCRELSTIMNDSFERQWPVNRVISWQGTWHIPRPGSSTNEHGVVTSVCGRYGYVEPENKNTLPQGIRILARRTKARECKHCLKMVFK